MSEGFRAIPCFASRLREQVIGDSAARSIARGVERCHAAVGCNQFEVISLATLRSRHFQRPLRKNYEKYKERNRMMHTSIIVEWGSGKTLHYPHWPKLAQQGSRASRRPMPLRPCLGRR